MTRAEQPTVVTATTTAPTAPTAPTYDEALAADSRERAVRALLRTPRLRRLWSAQLVSGIGDALALLVLVVLAFQAAVDQDSFGGGYTGWALAVAAVFGVRVLSTVLFGAVLLGPLSQLTAPGGALDRRWTMIGADGIRLGLFVVAPLWLDWIGAHALTALLATVFVSGAAERLWALAKDSAAPGLLPAPPPEGATVRPLPDHLDALRRLNLRTSFAALPVAAAALLAATLIGKALGLGVGWFAENQAALGSYVASGLFAASVSLLLPLVLPATKTPRPRSPLEGCARPGRGTGRRRGARGPSRCSSSPARPSPEPLLPPPPSRSCTPPTWGRSGGVRAVRTGPARRHRPRHPGHPGRQGPPRPVPAPPAGPGHSGGRPRAAADGACSGHLDRGVPLAARGVASGVAASTGHTLLDQETEEFRRARVTEHLQAVVRVAVAAGAVAAPVLAALIGPHRLAAGEVVFAHGGAAFTLMLVGALLLPVAVVVLAKADDRSGVPLRRDLREALRGGEPVQAASDAGFFIALEGGDGAGKSTQVQALADWIRDKGHEVVVTREPGATPVGKRLRSILLDVSSAGLSNRAEALLYAADRAEHVDTVVRPALERGAVVITDRYVDSSVAYQGAGRDLSPTEIARISRWATDGLVPNLTVLLDVSPEAARERFTEAPDRLESEPAEFHQRVRAGFLTLAAADPGRYLVVDAAQDPESVSTVVRHRLDRMLPLSEAEVAAQAEARRRAEEEAKRRAEEEAARKAEEARLLAEEEARQAREAEEARIEAAAEAARKEREERLRAEEEARERAEAERLRLEAEEKARAVERERLRKQAEEESRLRAEAEERRLEKQRRAEEALLKAEQARRLAAAAAAETAAQAAAAAAASAAAASASVPAAAAPAAAAPGAPEVPAAPAAPAPKADLRKADLPEAHLHEADLRKADRRDEPHRDEAVTIETPVVKRVVQPDDVTQTVPVPKVDPAAETSVLPPVRATSPADETAVLPPVRPTGGGGDGGTGAGAGTGAEAPRSPRAGYSASRPTTRRPEENPADRVPPGIFRDAGDDATRELPVLGEDGRPRRARSDWAEETPLDDLPTLADELLGPRRDDEDEQGRGPRRR